MNILALDLGKFNTMCCFFDTATRKYRFLTAKTDPTYLTTVFNSEKIDLVVMEAWQKTKVPGVFFRHTIGVINDS
jgi:hypothetical protein